MVKAFEHLAQFEGRSSFATWLTKIALHGAVRKRQRRKRLVALENAAGEMTAEVAFLNANIYDPEKQAIGGEIKGMLGLAVDLLPDAYRSVFMLREVEQMSTAETAECLNLSEEAVKTRLSRSRLLLRKDLEKQLGPIFVKCYSYLGERCDRTVKAVLERIRNKCSGLQSVNGRPPDFPGCER